MEQTIFRFFFGVLHGNDENMYGIGLITQLLGVFEKNVKRIAWWRGIFAALGEKSEECEKIPWAFEKM